MSTIQVQLYSGGARIPASYAALMPSELLHLLQELPPSYIALGAVTGDQPLGLAVASVHREESNLHAQLRCLTVAEAYRRKGIGVKLYGMLENVLTQQNVNEIRSEFIDETQLMVPRRVFFERCGFTAPVPGIYIMSGPLRQVLQELSWTASLYLPQGYGVIPLAQLTLEERSRVAAGCGIWYPPLLDPFLHEERIDRQRSLMLYRADQPIGWIILEAFDERTVLFKTLFVTEQYRPLGRGLALLSQAWRSLLEEGVFTEGIFFVEADNTQMVKLMHRKMDHPAIRKQMLWRTAKSL